MLVSQMVHTDYPVLQLTDKVSTALTLMEDYDVQHLPLQSDDKFIGLIAKDDLIDVAESSVIATIEEQILHYSVKNDEYFLAAVKLVNEKDLSLIAVTDHVQQLVGIIPAKDLLQAIAKFNGIDEPGGIVVLEVERRNFSFGEISRLVETNDAYITQLNTSTNQETGMVSVTIKINKAEISDIVSTFQRFDYSIQYFFGEEQYVNELKENYNQLMSYLNM